MHTRTTLLAIPMLILHLMAVQAQELDVDMLGLNSFHLSPESFWRASVVNTGNNKQVYLKGILKSRGQQPLFESVSSVLSLPSGATSLNELKVSTATVNFFSHELDDYVSMANQFPAGSYVACLEVYDAASRALVGSDCQEIDLELASPPFLLFPPNESTSSNRQPILTWSLPVPANLPSLSYWLRLVELLPGQAEQEAILRNPPLLEVKRLEQNQYPYPIDAPELEYNKRYAWQVKCLSGDYQLAQTEVWSFTLMPPTQPVIPEEGPSNYIDLLTLSGEGSFKTSQWLKFRYDEVGSRNTLELMVYDLEGQPMLKKARIYKARSGENLYKLDVSKLKGVRHQQSYLVRIADKNLNQSYTLRFSYQDALR